jgi:hypothetical protein
MYIRGAGAIHRVRIREIKNTSISIRKQSRAVSARNFQGIPGRHAPALLVLLALSVLLKRQLTVRSQTMYSRSPEQLPIF